MPDVPCRGPAATPHPAVVTMTQSPSDLPMTKDAQMTLASHPVRADTAVRPYAEDFYR